MNNDQNAPEITKQPSYLSTESMGAETTEDRMKVNIYMLKLCHMWNENHSKSERSSSTAPLSFHLL